MKTLQTLFSTKMLTRGIRRTHQGNNFFGLGRERGLSGKPGPQVRNATPQEQINLLTARQREVLRLVAEGKANKETASELCISIKTVEKHRGSLMERLGIHGTAGLTRFAIAAGVINAISR